MRINRAISSAQNLGIFDISDEGKVRFIVQEAGGSNEITIRGRLKGQPNFIFLKTLTGSINEVVNVFTYEELEIECTVCDPLTDQIKIYAASFSEAGGSAIDSIDVPSGDPITDFTSLSFSSSDDSITITGDNSTKTIDFTANGLNDLKDVSQIYNFHVYENNSLIYADASPGVRDTSSLLRDGWYFRNTAAGQKINWYYFDGTSQGNVTLGDLKSSYAVMTFDAVSGASSPIIAIYTFPTGTGDVVPGFAHSRIIYDGPMTPTPVVGKQYLVYAGENPPVHPQLPRINLALIPGLSIGDKLPTEQILTISLGSSSGAAVNQIQYMVETLGLFSDPVKHEMDLRIRTVPLNAFSKIDSIYLPSYVDDVEEYSSLTSFPLVGESSKIYVALDTNKIYRWSGSLYIEISEALVTSVNGDVGDVVIPIDDKVNKIGDTMTGDLIIDNGSGGTHTVSSEGSYIATADVTAEYTRLGYLTNLAPAGSTYQKYSDGGIGYLNLGESDYSTGLQKTVDIQLTGIEMLQSPDGSPATPIMPTNPGHVTVKKYVDDQDALKEDVANKSTDGTLASNSDTLYPSQKAVKTYADAITTSVTAIIDSLAYSQIIYVDKNNTRTYIPSGTIDKPFKSLEEMYTAITDASASKRYACIIAPGTYTEASTIRLKGWIDLTAFATDTVIIGVSGGVTLKWSNNSPGRVFIKDIGFTSGLQVLNDNPTGTSGLVFDLDNVDVPSLVFRGRGAGVDFIQLRNDTRISSTCTIQSASTTIFDSTNISTLIMNDDGCVTPDSFGSAITASLRSNYIGAISISATTYDIYTDAWGTVIAGNLTIASNASSYPCYFNYDATSYPLGTVTLTGTNPAQLVQTSVAQAIRYTPIISGNWEAPAPTEVKAALDQLANRITTSETSSSDLEDIISATKEPTGFLNREDSTISFDDSTRTFTISPVGASYDVYVKGVKHTKTTSSIAIIPPATVGNRFIYFMEDGLLSQTSDFNIELFQNNALVSIIYWNPDTGSHSYFADERHGLTMDGATHGYLHTVFGARYLSGLALQDFTIGDGSLDSHAQFSVDQGSIRDEDILLTSSVQSQIPILFRQGQLWRKKAADAFPLIYSDGIYYSGARIPFNEYTGSSWQLTAIDSNKFVLVHFFATNDKETPIVGIQGIAQYNDIPAARNAASTEITSLAGLPFAEFVAIGTVVFQTNTYTNTPDARVRSISGANYVDFRGTQLYTPAGEATEHSLLSGLGDDDHIQYHTDARGDVRYYTKNQIDSTVVYKDGTTPFAAHQSMGGFKLTNLADPVALTDAVNLQTLNSSLGSSNDIIEKSFVMYDEETIPLPITDFNFANLTARSFNALVSVRIQASSNLSETFEIRGIQKDSDWFISISSEGDSSGVVFSIDSSGQMHYTSGTYAGFVDGVIKFRAITTSV
jgi:hypothetical protein